MESVLIFFDEAIFSLEEDFISDVPPAQSQQMLEIKKELITIRDMIEQNRIPEKNKRYSGIARKIADEWPFQSRTGEKIIKALSEYRKL